MNAQATVQTQATKPTVTPVTHGLLQRCTATQECDECRRKREGLLQRAAVDSLPVSEVPPVVHEVLRSSGQPLDAQTRAFMELRFGHDFSDVRVHTDAKAAESARAVNALAYTAGHNVVFRMGQYAPQTSEGKELIAHELTHVIQQSGAVNNNPPVMRMRSSISDRFEKEANIQAKRIAQAQSKEAIPVKDQAHQSILQRQADMSQVPAGLPCRMEAGPGHPLGLNYVFNQSKADLLPEAKSDIALLISMDFRKDGVPDKIIIHGFASIESAQEFNWRLSCNRAESVKAELVRNGIPADKIETVAHGESTEFSVTNLSANRRAIIETVYRARPVQRKPYPKVTVWINSFIPHERVKGPPLHDCFAGDNRGFSSDPNASSRTHQLIEFVGVSNVTTNLRRIGTTHEVECDTGRVIDTGRASEDELSNEISGVGRTSADATVSFEADASNPLVRGAPAINLEATFRLNLVSRHCVFEMDHDGFPAYEAYLKTNDGSMITVYTYDPRPEGEGILDLFPPMDWTTTRNFSF